MFVNLLFFALGFSEDHMLCRAISSVVTHIRSIQKQNHDQELPLESHLSTKTAAARPQIVQNRACKQFVTRLACWRLACCCVKLVSNIVHAHSGTHSISSAHPLCDDLDPATPCRDCVGMSSQIESIFANRARARGRGTSHARSAPTRVFTCRPPTEKGRVRTGRRAGRRQAVWEGLCVGAPRRCTCGRWVELCS